MPRFSSMVRYQPQTFVPERSFQLSPSHVSNPGSPGRGTEWNSHSLAPVRASNARESPGGPCGISPTVAPSITMFLKTRGTPFHPTLISTKPSSPKPADASPVIAFTATSLGPAVKIILAGAPSPPGQYATPRAVVLPVGSLYVQTSFPVSASSARTRLPP